MLTLFLACRNLSLIVIILSFFVSLTICFSSGLRLADELDKLHLLIDFLELTDLLHGATVAVMEPSLKHLLKDEERQNDIELVMACESGRVLGVHIDTGPKHPPD